MADSPAQPSQIDGATRLPFAEAIAFFRQKLGNLVPTSVWTDLWKAQHDSAFMVAGATEADLLADLASAIDSAISAGTSLGEFRKAFRQIVAQRGWTGWTGEGSAAGTAWRTRVIYTTNTSTAYAAGRLAQLHAGGFALWVYRHDDSVLHPRPQHLAWNGLTLPADAPFWRTHYPPNGWNCFPAETPVRCAPKLGLRAFYRGKMVEFHTAFGHQLTLTANHAVLTGRGWISAQQLQEGDDLVGAAGKINSRLRGVIDDEQAPTSAAELFESLTREGLRVAPVAPHDFDGDALGMESEIHIAGADCGLMHEVQTALQQQISECNLGSSLVLPVESALAADGATLLPAVAGNPSAAQSGADGRFTHSEAFGDASLAGQAAAVERERLTFHRGVSGVGNGPCLPQLPLDSAGCRFDGNPAQTLGFGHAAQNNATLRKSAAEGRPAASHLFGQLLEANPGCVARDKIVDIREFEWAGHVYDFVTDTGLILAGGVIVSNCRCYVLGARDDKGASRLGGQPGKQPPDGWDATDPATGEPPGIDKGWGYQPGATVADTVRALAGKLQSLPTPLAKALGDDIARAAAGAVPTPPAPGA
ncbi:Prophage MuMc02, F protein (fragment) [Thiomonas sp. CB3]